MDEYSISWMVVIALGTLVGLFLTVGKPIIKLNSTLTELITRMENAETDIKDFSLKNHESHRRIHERIDHVDNRVDDVEKEVERIKDGRYCIKK